MYDMDDKTDKEDVLHGRRNDNRRCSTDPTRVGSAQASETRKQVKRPTEDKVYIQFIVQQPSCNMYTDNAN